MIYNLLLKSGNFPTRDEELVKVTISKLQLNVQLQLQLNIQLKLKYF